MLTLEETMEAFGVDKALLKTAGAKVGEVLGRLKPNEHLTGYSPLSRVLELEMLRSGVQGKLALWDSLYEISETDDRLDPDGLQALDRARRVAARRPASTTGWPPSHHRIGALRERSPPEPHDPPERVDRNDPPGG